MNMKTFEMCEKRLAEILGVKVLWEFISVVTEEIEKQELETTPGLVEDLFIHVSETIQIQNMNKNIIKSSKRVEADSTDVLFVEAYIELINHKFLISELVIELSFVLKELNDFVQLSLSPLQNRTDYQEP